MIKKEEDIVIRPAKARDIKGILAVQKALLLKNKSQTNVGKEGFLVYPVEEEELRRMINREQNFLFVAEGARGIVGYALACDLEEWRKNKPKWDEEMTVDAQIKSHLSKDKILYFRHIARINQYPGVGRRLEEEVYALAENQGYKDVIAEILEKPILNEKSKEVHGQRGYKRIGQVEYLDGKIWGLYEKKLKSYRQKNLEAKVSLILIGGFILSIVFFSGMTGYTILDFNNISNNWFKVMIFFIVIIGVLFLIKLNKK